MAIPALHVHIEMQFMLADLGNALMAPEAILVLRPHLSWCMRLVALVAIELHWSAFIKHDLLCLFDRCRIGNEKFHIHGAVFFQLLADALVGAVAVKAFLSARPDVLGTIRVTVDASKAAHTFTMHLFSLVAFIAEFFRGKEVM